MKKNTLFSLALAAGLALSPSLADAQTKVMLTTTKAVGSEFSFVTNPGKITVDWGDGKQVELSTVGESIKGELKGQTVTVSCDNLWFLDCSSNELTAFEIADGLNLKALYCSDNKLTSLDLNQLRNLETLDCSENEMETLGLTLLRNLTSLNCSDNKISSLSLTNQTQLKSLICYGNSISSLLVSSAPNLETLWCQDNKLNGINLASNSKLQSVVLDNNNIGEVNVSNCTGMIDFWCDNNQLKSLNITKSVGLQTLSCSNNQLTTLKIPMASSTNKALAFYCDGNKLTFGSMHSMDNVQDLANTMWGPQQGFLLPKNQVNVGDRLNLEGFEKNVDGDQIYADFIWKQGDTELTVGDQNDYTMRSSTVTFYKPFDAVYCEVTSDYYPGVVLTSESLAVVDPSTGIKDVMSAYGFSYVTNNGMITMKSNKPYRVNIYTVDGKQVWNGVVTAEQKVSLGHGIFLINGVKISL